MYTLYSCRLPQHTCTIGKIQQCTSTHFRKKISNNNHQRIPFPQNEPPKFMIKAFTTTNDHRTRQPPRDPKQKEAKLSGSR